jgi:hypothetical protein
MSNLSIAWTKHLPPGKSKEDFEKIIRNSVMVMSRLRDIINEKEQELSRSETTEKDFETPSWAYKQAYRNGQRATLRDLKSLLQFLDG